MSDIPALHNFVAGQPILDTEVEADFETIRSTFNTYAVQTDTVKTITVTHLVSATTPFRFTGTGWVDGDLIYLGSGNGTLTRLAKGTAGEVLRMNSGATAPEWAPAPYWIAFELKIASATAADLAMWRQGAGGEAGLGGAVSYGFGTSQPIKQAGSITAIFAKVQATRVAGSLIAEVHKPAATGLIATIDGSNANFHLVTQATGLDTVAAGDEINVVVDTSSFDPVVNQSVWVEVQITPS